MESEQSGSELSESATSSTGEPRERFPFAGELDLPADRFASRRATTLRLQPDPRGITTIEYRVGDRMTRTKHVEAIVRNRETATGTTDLSGRTGRVTLALSLVAARADSENDTAAHVALAVRDGG